MLAARHVVEENDLRVLGAPFNLLACGIVAWAVVIRINADNLAITLVPEQQALVRIGIGSEVGGVIDRRFLAVPVVVAKIGLLWHEILLTNEVRLELLFFHAIRQIYVTANFVFARFLIPEEEDCCHSTIFEVAFAALKLFQESVARKILIVTCKGLEFLGLV